METIVLSNVSQGNDQLSIIGKMYNGFYCKEHNYLKKGHSLFLLAFNK